MKRTSKTRRPTSELASANSELLAKVQDLERSNAELSLFAYTVSHELQEPVRKLLGLSERLREELTAHGAPPETLGRILSTSARMQSLIHDLLTWAKVTSSGQNLEKVDLQEAVEDASATFQERFSAVGATIMVGPLPCLQGDRSQLRQLFENLIGNALKFRKTDQPLRVAISARDAKNGFVEVRVEDNGIGFDPQYAQRVFEPFQRLNRREHYDGSGMGLAICRRILFRHGGVISASSNPGNGTVFTVTLPV